MYLCGATVCTGDISEIDLLREITWLMQLTHTLIVTGLKIPQHPTIVNNQAIFPYCLVLNHVD